MSNDFSTQSYSQLGEDRVLAHLFKKLGRTGIYIDAGAFHPLKYSNTAILHKMGWSGMNIDLSEHTIRLFKEIRPNDISLQYAITDKSSSLTCYLFGEGESTLHTADYETAVEWKKIGRAHV